MPMISFAPRRWSTALFALLAFNAVPAAAQSVMAVCTDPKGRGFETTPAKGWVFNRLKDAVITFSRDRAGRPDILIRDRSRTVSLARDGAKLTVTHQARNFNYFIITAVYQQAQVDTFQVTFLPNGKGQLVWTSVRSHLPPKDETRATFLVADCEQ
ncbi:hypothetical protein ACFOMD_05050 [Sphingoaurantiacus capsulatus]|uniref:Uncharacterized protein n=1 Tax=Sphingoaurantiacus capsulatus TaxID=1771310 RepID=A0ABV7X7U6_9SPHN